MRRLKAIKGMGVPVKLVLLCLVLLAGVGGVIVGSPAEEAEAQAATDGLYMVQSGSLYRITPDGSAQAIIRRNVGGNNIGDIATDGAYIYASDSGQIYRYDFGGRNGIVLNVARNVAGGVSLFTIGTNKFYWYSVVVPGTIYSANLDATGAATLLTGAGRINDLLFHNAMLYWVDSDTFTIKRIGADGSGRPQTIISDVRDSDGRQVPPTSISINGDKLYWTTGRDGGLGVPGIYRADLNGANRQQLLSDNSIRSPITTSDAYLYYSQSPMIKRANLDGTAPTDFRNVGTSNLTTLLYNGSNTTFTSNGIVASAISGTSATLTANVDGATGATRVYMRLGATTRSLPPTSYPLVLPAQPVVNGMATFMISNLEPATQYAAQAGFASDFNVSRIVYFTTLDAPMITGIQAASVASDTITATATVTNAGQNSRVYLRYGPTSTPSTPPSSYPRLALPALVVNGEASFTLERLDINRQYALQASLSSDYADPTIVYFTTTQPVLESLQTPISGHDALMVRAIVSNPIATTRVYLQFGPTTTADTPPVVFSRLTLPQSAATGTATFILDRLLPNSQYAVQASLSADYSDPVIEFFTTTLAPPNPPTGLRAQPGGGSGRLNLTWHFPVLEPVDAYEYRIKRCDQDSFGGNFQTISGAGPDTTAAVLSSLTDDQCYDVVLYALNEGRRSLPSNIARGTPDAASPLPEPVPEPEPLPDNLQLFTPYPPSGFVVEWIETQNGWQADGIWDTSPNATIFAVEVRWNGGVKDERYFLAAGNPDQHVYTYLVGDRNGDIPGTDIPIGSIGTRVQGIWQVDASTRLYTPWTAWKDVAVPANSAAIDAAEGAQANEGLNADVSDREFLITPIAMIMCPTCNMDIVKNLVVFGLAGLLGIVVSVGVGRRSEDAGIALGIILAILIPVYGWLVEGTSIFVPIATTLICVVLGGAAIFRKGRQTT